MPYYHFGRTVPITLRKFPNLNLYKFEGNKPISIPSELESFYNIIIFGFKKTHLSKMSSWIPFVRDLKDQLQKRSSEENTVSIYSVILRHRFQRFPLLFSTSRWLKNLKDLGFSDNKSIISLYGFLDFQQFFNEIQLPDAQRPYMMMVKPDGEIFFCEHEEFDASKEKAIYEFIGLKDNHIPSQLPPRESPLIE